MKPTARVIAWRLLCTCVVSYDDIINHLYGDREDGGPDYAADVIKVMLCGLRKECPVKINTIWGRGFMIAPEDRDIYHDWLIAELKSSLIRKERYYYGPAFYRLASRGRRRHV